MTITTHRTVTDIYHHDDGRLFELPIHDEWEMAVRHFADDDGIVTIGYLVHDDLSSWTPEEVLGDDVRLLSPDTHNWSHGTPPDPAECAECGYHTDDHDIDKIRAANPGYTGTVNDWIGCDQFQPNDLRKAIDAGRAFPVERYEHGMCRYALTGESSAVDRAWDVSRWGVIVFDGDDWGDTVNFEDMARSILNSYTAWANGSGCGWVVARYNETHRLNDTEPLAPTEHDDCYGYFTAADAEADMPT